MNKHEDKKKPTAKNIGITILIIALVIGLLFSEDIQNAYTDYFEEEVPHEVLTPARIELYNFSDLASNTSVNVEIWLTNIGETTANNITIFVRALNQNNTKLYEGNISLTVVLLQENENCTGYYVIQIVPSDTKIKHTIEISWADGRNTYHKETTL